MDARKLDLHVLAQLQVEGAERFVEEQDGRPLGQRSRERHSLGLPTRQLPRIAVAILREADQLEILADPLPDLAIGQALHPQAERDIVGDGHVREERVILEDGIDVASVWGQVIDALTLDPQLARRERDEPADQV